MIQRLAILGVGLIGGSFVLALKRAGLVGTVVGFGRNPENLAEAQRLGVIDVAALTVAEAVAGADAICLAVPVGVMPTLFQELAPHLAPEAIITDVGSTKQDVITAACNGLGARVSQFVPGHPIAGAEDSGAAAARPELFHGKAVILTPLPANHAADVQRVSDWWQACGAVVSKMASEAHDRVFAAVSHLPHLAAFALVAELAERPDALTYFQYAGSGFRDFTRIAASHPEMWRDIALANRGALLQELDAYLLALSAVRHEVAEGDSAALIQRFTRASQARRKLVSVRDSQRDPS